MNTSLYSRINHVHSPDGELSAGVSGKEQNDKMLCLARTRIALLPLFGADTEETDVMILCNDLCSVLNALSK